MREHYQKRDRLRLVLDYRKKYLDLLLRGGEEEAKQAEADYERARTQADQDYEETAAAVADPAFVPEGRLRIARRFNAGIKPGTTRVPKGRLRAGKMMANVMPVQPSLRDLFPRLVNPALKCRAILGRPYGTGWPDCPPFATKADTFNPTNTVRRIRCDAF